MNTLRNLLKIGAGALAFLAVRVLSALIFPFSVGLSALPPQEQPFVFPGLLLTALGFSALVWFVRRRSPLGRKTLAVRLGAVFLGINTLQTQIETLYFWAAFPVITPRDMAFLFLGGILTTLFWIPAVLGIFGKKSPPEAPSVRDWQWDPRPFRYVLAALVYVPLYLGFGMIAQLAPALQAEYAEWTASPELVNWLPLWQVFRGAGFLGLSVLALSLFPRRTDASLGLALMAAFFISLELLSPSVLMSPALRMVHFGEITLSMVLYGWTVSRLVTRTIPPIKV